MSCPIKTSLHGHKFEEMFLGLPLYYHIQEARRTLCLFRNNDYSVVQPGSFEFDLLGDILAQAFLTDNDNSSLMTIAEQLFLTWYEVYNHWRETEPWTKGYQLARGFVFSQGKFSFSDLQADSLEDFIILAKYVKQSYDPFILV